MEQSTIAIIILVIVLLLYATEALPIVVTATLSVCAMVLLGIISPTEGLAGFANTATILGMAAMVMGEALAASGATAYLSRLMGRAAHLSKRNFNTLLCAVSALLSAFLSSLAIILIMMTVVDGIIVNSNHKFNRRESYMPIAIGSSIGGAISLAGSSSVLTACAVYNQYMGQEIITFFGPAVLAIPATLGAILFYATVGTRLSEKWFNFEEPPLHMKAEAESAQEKPSKTKVYLSLGIFLVCAVLWVSTSINIAIVGLLGMSACFLARCIKPDRAFTNISWNSLVVLALSLGFASGVHASGADLVIADFIISICGPLGRSEMGMFLVIMLLTIFLTNIMSNTATAAVVAPIAITIAEEMGVDPMLWCIGIGVGANCAVCTPIGCANMTVLLPAGYRFKDFFKPGICVCAVSMVLMCLVYAVVH